MATNLENQISELYGLMQETVDVSVTVPRDAWHKSIVSEHYEWNADVSVPAANGNIHFAIVDFTNPDHANDVTLVRAAGIAPYVNIPPDGRIIFYAERQPTADLRGRAILFRVGAIPKRRLYRREEKGLILDYYSDGDIRPAGEHNPDESIFTFENAAVSGNGDVSVDNKSISTLTIAVNNDYPTHAVGNGKKLVISWSGNDSATAKFPDARLRFMAAPASTETAIGFNLSSKRSKGMSLAMTLYSCKRGASLGSVGTEYGQYTITPINDGVAHHYRIPLTDFGVKQPITLGEDDTLELKIHWSNTAFTDQAGDLVLIDNIGFFEEV